MEIVKYLIVFVIFFVISFILYYGFVVSNQIREKKGRGRPKKKNLPQEVILLRDYYKVDIDKIGLIRILRILNVVNSLIISFIAILALPFDEIYIKLIIIVVLIFPTIWFSYYFLAKYLKHLEEK